MRRQLPLLFLLLVPSLVTAQDLPQMKFNEVKEVAPGVFFRYSSIHATDKSVRFGGSNHIWVVFEDFVVVIDANFPKQATDALKDIKKTTDKPIRYVLDTHHHGDHAYGNAVWAKEGATIIGQTNCFRLLRTVGPDQWRQAAEGKDGKTFGVADSVLKTPSLVFDDRLVLDDGKQRVEFLFFGHAHTPGDAVAYLPQHKILCTGDACVNGAFNFMGHSDTASWIRVLEKMEQLDVKMICPGHGPVAGKDLLARQKRYFQDLRANVKKGIDDKKSPDEIAKGLNLPWYQEWTGTTPSPDNVKHVFAELTGKINHSQLGMNLDFPEGDSYWRGTPGWTPPRRIVVPNLSPARIAELKTVAPRIEFVVARTTQEAVKLAADADAVLGYATPEVLRAGEKLRWVQTNGENVGASKKVSVTRTPGDDGQWLVWRENVRRFAAGERLVWVVE